MRRWPIAILTLHFFASVVLFAFGQFHALGQDIPDRVFAGSSSTEASGATHPQQHVEQLDLTPDHGLTDGQPDLPDTVQAHVSGHSTDRAPGQPSTSAPLKFAPPTLEGLQRPPCACAVA
ncbi:hypothetical protein AZ34_04705 [Hylemonella gracilis str. Niagara R]|uniref:Uncharacterized protein n=1 Tax=Hylemonella gracilis str. Niagara R TaxID=1458275 RepID=A0A016XNK9_9BURK|nr:hypothetical protein [Hylemonella gracilis]EYC52803.1 hypothetical protein AZ34_04705 [Hylemonella gracilis str. Niagara R]